MPREARRPRHRRLRRPPPDGGAVLARPTATEWWSSSCRSARGAGWHWPTQCVLSGPSTRTARGKGGPPFSRGSPRPWR